VGRKRSAEDAGRAYAKHIAAPIAASDSAILPVMRLRASDKPSISIVGAGNLARALAVSLRAAAYEIDQIISRKKAASMRRARRLASEAGASVAMTDESRIGAEIIWFCVPDAAIASAADSLDRATDWKGRIALHSSGALGSDELGVLRRRGAAVASVHPLMTFVRGSRPALSGVSFAIEGDTVAVRAARRIVKNLGGDAYSIRAQDKAAYHAWGTFASPLFTALLVTAEHVAGRAHVTRKAAKRRMLPILRQTLENYAALDAAGAFSGPIVRGDIATVRKHLRMLSELPVGREVYLSLAKAALAYLPGKNKSALLSELKPGQGSARGKGSRS